MKLPEMQKQQRKKNPTKTEKKRKKIVLLKILNRGEEEVGLHRFNCLIPAFISTTIHYYYP